MEVTARYHTNNTYSREKSAWQIANATATTPDMNSEHYVHMSESEFRMD